MTLTKYNGDGGDVVIPAEIEGRKVIRIGDSAFSWCMGLTGITIPNSVMSIGVCAFQRCTGLTSVTIPNRVTSIGAGAFRECSGLTNITIPNSVTNIGDFAFQECTGLTSITIPDRVTSIWDSAFLGCSALMEITIPSSVKGIGEIALGYCMEEKGDVYKNPDFVIYGESGSEAESYAKDNGFDFDKSDGDTDTSERNIVKAEVTLSQNSYTYDGQQKRPFVTVKLNGKTLKVNEDYLLIYHNNVDVGTAQVIIIGKGKYTGYKPIDYTIAKSEKQPDFPMISCKKKVYKTAYGAKPFTINATSKSKLLFISCKPGIVSVDKNTGQITVKGTGIASITIKAGRKAVSVLVKVSPKEASLKSLRASNGRRLTVKWAKDKMATGYQLQVSTAKNFKKNLKKKNLSGTSYTFTKLKTGKKYYVRIRSYKKCGMETLYGTWSKVKQSNKIKN